MFSIDINEVAVLDKFSILAKTFEEKAMVTEWADMIGPRITEAMKRETPYKTGRLQGSERYQRQTSAMSVELQWHSNVPYAPFVIKGTKPHEIRPVAARALAWPMPNPTNFAAVVHHPGTKPNDFPQRALDSMREEIASTFAEAVRAAMEL